MKLEEKISNWLDEYLTSNNLESFVIGVSGGIDSAVTSTLCAMTGKPTIVLSMPIHQSKLQLNRANNHLKWLKSKYPNVRVLEFDLTQLFETFKLLFTEEDNLALANTRSRLRMVTLYQVATMNKGIVAGTGNKVEDFGVGFYTKYGDGGVDISPIADLYKSEVKELAKSMEINFEIIEAAPTDGLWGDNRTDEDQIGASYEELEWAMQFTGDPNILTGRNKEVYYIYRNFNTKNKHKMLSIPIFKKH
jgi:NAD+ synthase